MKYLSLDPFFKGALPTVKTILLFGNHTELKLFRVEMLQRIYKSCGYIPITVKTWSSLVQILTPHNDLFQKSEFPYFIFVPNVTDVFFKEEKLESLLTETTHVLLLESNTLTSRSAPVAAYERGRDYISLGCYEINFHEINRGVEWMAGWLDFTFEEEIKQRLVHHLLAHLPDFFSLLEFISLYTGETVLEESALDQILQERLFSTSKNLSVAFFQQDTARLIACLEDFENSEAISQIRLLLHDLIILMGISAHQLSSDALMHTWKKGPVKFPFPFLSFYQSVLNKNWSLERGYRILAGLLNIEMTLKSGDTLTPAIFKQSLLNLM